MATLGAAAARRVAAERWFFSGMSVAILGAVVLGFARTFFLRPWFPAEPVPPEPFFLFHGVLFAAWFALLVVQPSLVAAGRLDLHRRLGQWGAGLAAAMVVAGCWGALIAAGRPGGFIGPPIPPLKFLAIPLFDMVIFAALVSAAVARRGAPQTHKRLMLIASIALLPAAIARWPFWLPSERTPLLFFPIADLFLLAIVAWDLATRRRLHPATAWGGAVLLLSQPLRLAVMQTEAWQAFARWAVGWVR